MTSPGLPESVRKYLEYHTAEGSGVRQYLTQKVLEMLDYSKCVKSQELTDRLDVRRHYSRMLEEGVIVLVLRGKGRESCVMVAEDLERLFRGYLPKALEDFLERYRSRDRIRGVLERVARGERISWDDVKSLGDSALVYALRRAREEGLLWYVEVGGRRGRRGYFLINPALYAQ